jgi:membrane protein DedA with SNARE-associated domain
MSDLAEFFANNPWSAYLLAFIGPFVQEDVAILTAATSAAAGGDHVLLLSTWVGVIISDGWKYWAGRLAHRIPWAAKIAASPGVAAASEQVHKRLGMALIVARFVPGTRIPLNVACGLFRVPFVKFLVLISLSAAIYIGLAYGLFAALGAIVGERVRAAIPFVVVPLVLVLVGVALWRGSRRKPGAPSAP